MLITLESYDASRFSLFLRGGLSSNFEYNAGRLAGVSDFDFLSKRLSNGRDV
jgi:hypothetical protein